MPIVVRYVEPIRERYLSAVSSVSRPRAEPKITTPEEYKDTDALLSVTSGLQILESVCDNKARALSVHNIATLIRQLGSVAEHAESVMGTLAEGLATCHSRTVLLGSRLTRLAKEVLPYLDPDMEAVEGFEIPHPDFQFRSKREVNQFILTEHHPPQPLEAQIHSAHTPPLHLLSPLWSDGRNATHLYSNPDFFFEHWRVLMNKETMRRKSGVRLLSPTSPDPSKPNGKIRNVGKVATGKVAPANAVVKLKRNTGKSFSFRERRRPRPQSMYSSNHSLQNVGLVSAGSSKKFHRSHTVRMPPGYTRSKERSPLRIPKVKNISEPLSKAIALNFNVQTVELIFSQSNSLPHATNKHSDRQSKSTKGGFLGRSLSARQYRSRSHSKSPIPPPVEPNESIFNGAHMYMVDDEKNKVSHLSILPRKHLENLDLGATEFEACLAIGDSPKMSSTFIASPNLSARALTPTKPWAATSSDAREQFNKLPWLKRSATIANSNSRPVVKRGLERLKLEGRPASLALPDYQFNELQPAMSAKSHSQASLDTSRNTSALSNYSRPSPYLNSMLPDDLPLIKPKPRRPAPHRPLEGGSKSSSDSGGHVTPDITDTNNSPDKKGPPSIPLRNDRLYVSSTPKSAGNVATGSGPATPGSTHAAKRHSTLDSDTRESVATALSDVLNNMKRKSLTKHQGLSPILKNPENSNYFAKEGQQTPVANGDLNRTLTPGKSSPIKKFEKIMSPIESAPPIDLDETLTSFEKPQPEFGTFTSAQHKENVRVARLRSRQGSLYISPQKLSGFQSPQDHCTVDEHGFHKRADQILKAGGVDNRALEETRVDLLTAIRKGLQLKKVGKETDDKRGEVAWDVAAILGRYEVLHTDDEDGSDCSDDGWDDFDEP